MKKIRPHPFTLRQLQYACAVAEHLSFRRAAESCSVAQPSLSAQIAELESALGVQLFERSQRRVLVTPQGQALLERAHELLVRADDFGDAVRRGLDPFGGTLRVGVIPTIAPYLLPLATAAIRARYPQLTVHWVEDKTESLSAQLASGALDAALLALEAELGDIEHDVIAIDPFVLAAPLDHALLREPGPIPLSRLRAASMLLLDDGHCLREQALEFCSTVKAHELSFRATSLATLVQLVVQDMGVTLLPSLALETETARAALGIREIAAPPPHRTLAVIWRRGSPAGPAARGVAAAIRENYPLVAASKEKGVRSSRAAPGPRERSSRRNRNAVS